LLVRSERLRWLAADEPWTTTIEGRPVVVGGSSYRERLPDSFAPPIETAGNAKPLVVWLAHHDILVPGYEPEYGRRPSEIPGIDVVVNGHVHTPADPVVTGATTWLHPGSICRRSRGEKWRDFAPAVLRIDVTRTGWRTERIEVPHAPYDEVFHPRLVDDAEEDDEHSGAGGSAFVAGLAELQARRTDTAAGLRVFLDRNLDQFDPAVAAVIRELADEVLDDDDADDDGQEMSA